MSKNKGNNLAASVLSGIIGAVLGSGLLVWLGATDSARRTHVVDVVKNVSPAVVNISTEQVVQRTGGPSPYSPDPMFDEFFRDFFDPRLARKQVRHSLGSGVIIDPEGRVLTNEHVIAKASKITVTLVDGRELATDLIGSDSETDLAVLKIKAPGKYPFLPMGNSDDIMVGEPAVAIGNPFGLGHTVTSGVVSAIHRSLKTGDKTYLDFLQTDASINPGNSGGPLINADGSLIGINTAIYQKAQGIGFAIPINRARRIVDDLLKFGEVHVGWIGVEVQDLTKLSAGKLGYTGLGGVVISLIADNSPAKKSDLELGDIIEAINGREIRSREDFRSIVKSLGVGEDASFEVYRAGKRLTVKIVTADFPVEMGEDVGRYALGIQVGQAPAGIKAVSLTMVATGSPAQKVGLKTGDLILKINNDPISNVEDYKKAMAKARIMDNVVLLVRRGPSIYYVTIPLRP